MVYRTHPAFYGFFYAFLAICALILASSLFLVVQALWQKFKKGRPKNLHSKGD